MAKDVFTQDADNARDDMRNAMEIQTRDNSYYGKSQAIPSITLKERQGRNVLDHSITHRPPVIGPADYGD